MPSQSWMPMGAASGLLIFGMGMTLMTAGVPFCGYVAIAGLAVVFLFIFLWALEGPGGYHIAVPEPEKPSTPAPAPGHQRIPAGHH